MSLPSFDPSVGEIQYDGGRNAWTGRIKLPGLDAFTSTFAAEDDEGYVPGQYALHLEADGPNDLPSPAATGLVARLAENDSQLARAIAIAMWDDFSGKGPKSGMWWHGNLGDVQDEYDSGLPPLDGPDTVFAWMRPEQVIVRNSGAAADEDPVIEIVFAAPFEIEHSVGVLTDGINVLGTGYSLDVGPFESE